MPAGTPFAGLWARLQSRLGDADQQLVQRLAGTVFMIRVIAAALAYISNVLFARWMGTFEFGVFVYVWTWVLLIGPALDLGLATAAQRFIPEYRERGLSALLRGYVSRSRWVALAVAIVIAALCAGLVRLLTPYLDSYNVIPLYIACIALPAFAVANVQDGIARSYDWVGLAIVPGYIVRQLLLTALMAVAYFGGLPVDAATAVALSAVAVWLPLLVQMLVLNRRLAKRIEPGPTAHDAGLWIRTGMPILMAESFYLLLTHTDLLMLQQFRPPEDVAVYYAAVKTLALVAFIHFSIAAATAHRVAACHAAGDREGLAALIRRAMHLTFWPSLVATALLLALGKPILSLFGAQFVDGYHLMFILAVGLLARAGIGPMERFLNVIGEQRGCALVYSAAFAVNIALCFVLIPPLGAAGAAIAISSALVLETMALIALMKRRMGLDIFVWRRRS
ncbi:MAG: lipopolysaccharide biosynthesis protein [Xanthobacteraceae bacterium]|nr:lipopolysaccharide biosynthesis protein [Xanthobacteraceae bacterium]